jgi:hypothetical protein
MIHEVPKDSYVEVVESRCEYHKTHPNQPNYAGCTCCVKYSLKTGKKPEEKKDVQEHEGT